jgi:uncharacterized Zn finger protein (UPF0148 family)
MGRAEGATRCPVCGRGTVVDIVFDEPTPAEPDEVPRQEADSRERDLYSCGHEVPGPSLALADSSDLAVERRQSEDTVEPIPEGDDA